ncbi:Ig-like domain repeat protein [Streptomyces sp. NPDC014724]|uniref:Ig-like domain repeat protein n=1 Tax=unclassified Streptomyces TaxID=2593676 RepID=UPI0036F4B8CB
MSVYPSQGPYSGGTQVVVVGRNFLGATAVFFGARAALAFTVLDDRTIVAVTPAGNDTVQVAVTTPGGTAPVGAFSYLRWPMLCGLVPTTGPLAGGGTVTLTGTGLSTVSSVHFGSAAEFPTALSDQQLLVTAPPAAVPGTVAVYAIATGGVSNRLAYTYAAAPQVTSVTPADGPVAGATTIVIRGTGLSTATGVTVGGIAAPSFRSNSDALILAVTPPGVAGPATVAVTTPGGTAALPDAFSYLAASVTALTSEPDPSVSGQPVVFTATVTATPLTAGTPSGTVTVDFGDGTPSVTAPLVEGTATVTHAYADPSGSPYTVTAAYSGDDLCYPSSDTVTHTVQPAATTVTVAPTPDPSAAGEPVTFVARVVPVAPGAGTVTGTVTFDFGDSTAPVTIAVSGAVASATHAFAGTAGSPYTVTAAYGGDTGFAPATGTAAQSVAPADSSTLVSLTPTPSATGEPVTVTASVAAVAPGGGTPTGAVTFDFGDGTAAVTAPLTAGVATTTHAFGGTVGSPFTVSATYGGDADIAPSVGTGSQTVQAAATTTALTAAPDPAVVGEQVTFTASMTTTPPGTGTPPGTVTFDFGDGTPPVTATLSGGVATTTHTYSSTADSPFTVTASYGGSPDHTTSQDTGSQTVQPAASTTALTAAPDPAVVGEQVTFTASVTTTPPGTGTPPGTVTFDFGDGTPPVTATLTDGVATTTHAFTQAAATPYPVTATYNGSPDYTTSQDNGGQAVQPAATTTTVAAAPDPASVGQTTTFVARVTPRAPASGSPSGTVTFGFSDGTGPLTAPVVGGTPTVTRTSPGVADSPTTVTAAYSGDFDFTASTGSGTYAVAQGMTTTEVSAAPEPSVTDEQVTFTATVTALPPATGTPTGTVTFDFGDGTTPVSAGLVGGTATTVHTYTVAAAVPYSVSVTYGGDTDFTASTGAATHTVTPAGTTTTVTVSPDPSVTGEPVTVTVVPAGTGSTVPTGTVTVDFGDGSPAATVLLVAGTATVVHAYIGTAGSPYTVTADYSGDTDFAPSQGTAVQTVTAAGTTTSVAASAEPSATGQTVTLIARVATVPPGSGAPGGTVTFDFGDGTAPATAALTGGTASVTHAYTGTEGSPYTVTAAYSGNTDFAPSTTTGTHAVAASVSATATTVTAAPEASTSGQEVTFTASVAAVPPASGTPTGTVTFDFGDGSTPVAATLSSGTAGVTHTYATAAGSPYTVTAVYGGDADFAGSTGIETHGVSPAASTTALVTAPAAALTGQPVTFTATVTGGGDTPTGTVTFDFGDGTPVVTVPVTGGAAATVHAYAHSAGSPYAVTAAYSGDAGVTGSTATGTQTVTAAASSTAIVASPQPSVVGQEFTFTATVGVLPPASGTPTGTVTFDFGDGTPAVTVPVSGGVAVGTHTYTDTTGSPYTVSAAYSGDSDIAASSGAISHTVGRAGTTTSAAVSPDPSVVGEPVIVTATVTPVAPGAWVPDGTVTFDFGDGTAPLTAPLVGGAATVAHPYAATTGSPYVITSAYGGSTQYTGSLGTATQTVGQVGTTTAVSASADPSAVGQPVTVTATVAPAGPGPGLPTGTVTFDFGDGSPPVPGPLNGGTATAEHTYDGQPVGNWTVGAAYGGDGDFTASAGTATQTVRRAMTALAVASSADPSVTGQPVTFTATAVPLAPGDGAPTGTVTFDFGDGTGPVTAPLVGGTAEATHTYTDADVSGTPYGVTAAYGGDTGFRPSNGALTQTVARADTVTAVTTSPDLSVAGQPVTVTATVSPAAPGAGTPSGTVTFDFGDGAPALTVPMADGTAVATHVYLGTGGSPYTVTAAYGGDTDFAPSTGTGTHTTGQAVTVTALSELPDPSVPGQPVTFTAVVSAAAPGAGVPTGSVTFDFGDGSVPVAVSPAGGTATVEHTYSAGTGGSLYTLTAAYDGDDDFAASAATATHTLLRARTEVTITSSDEPSVAGEAVAFTAAAAVIAPGDGTPTGTVTFDFGDGTPAVTVPVSGGVALGTHTYTDAAGTPYAVTATYNGDTGFRPSTGVLAQTVGRAGTATSVTTSPDPSVAGQSVTLTATVAAIAPGVGTPTGTVTFDFGDGTPAVTATLSGGTATATHPYAGTTGSSYSITATFDGDADFAPSTGTATHTTGQAATTTTVTTSPDPSTPGEQVTVIARVGPVAPGAGTPTGSVTFDFGDATPTVSAPLSGGVATSTHTFADVSVTPYDVTAAYSGDADFTASSGTDAQTITADAVSTTTTVTSAPNPSVTGQTVSFTATVAATASGAGVPTGGVTFDFGDGTPPVTAAVNGAVATAQHTYTGPADRTFSVTAAYSGDATFSYSTGTTVQTVDKAPATATVTTSPDPSVAGQPVTINATVTPAGAGAGVPTGTVTFGFGDGTPSASAPLTNGVARLTHTYAHTAGSPYPVAASYNGDGDFTPAGAATTQTVTAALATVALASSPDPSVVGQPVTLTATVASVAPGAGTPTGTLTFTFGDGTAPMTATLTGGIATAQHAYDATGPYTVAAAYSGDTDFAAAADTDTQTVSRATTTTALVSSPDPSVVGQPVTFTATVAPVAPGAGTPTGTLTFTFGDGTATASAPLVNGVATTQHTYSAAGPYTVTAAYGNDSNFRSSSGTDTQTVNQTTTTTALTSSPDPSVVGQAVTFTATVAPVAPGAGTPTGTLTFTFGDGTATASAPLINGVATLTHTYATRSGSPFTVTAAYNGSPDYAPSTGTDTQTVNQATTTTTVATTPDPSVIGQPVTLTATVAPVAPGAGTPTGTLTFTFGDGTATASAPLVNGVATLTHTYATRSGSPFTVTAAYNGSPDYAPSTGTDTQTLNRATTKTALTSSPDPSVVGQPVTFTATVAPATPATGTPTGTVTFTWGDGTASASAPLVNGVATLTHTYATRSGSPFTITAAYGGDTSYTISSGTDTQTVNRATTTTTVATTPDPSVIGQQVTITAAVTAAAPASGTPTGTVTFSFGNGTAPVTAVLSNGVATATTTYTGTTGSPFSITAAYGGDTGYAPSTGTDTQTVSGAATTTAVTTSPNPSRPGTKITATATVASVPPATGTPTGYVTLVLADRQTHVLQLTGGIATTTFTPVNAGTYLVTATYSGTGTFAPSTGTTTQIVDQPPNGLPRD